MFIAEKRENERFTPNSVGTATKNSQILCLFTRYKHS